MCGSCSSIFKVRERQEGGRLTEQRSQDALEEGGTV